MTSSGLHRTESQRGIAMLIVVTVLVTMVIVALPFAMSMRQGRERTEAVVARDRATFEADLLADLAKTWLKTTLPGAEAARWEAGERLVASDPTVDSLAEITPDERFRQAISDEILTIWALDDDERKKEIAKELQERGLTATRDNRGSIWTLLVEDAQARVNANGCSPFLLGNLMGSALLTDALEAGATEIPVSNLTSAFSKVAGFDPDGGFIRIGGETIQYESFDGSSFRGCVRGALRNAPLKDNGEAMTHKQGTPVIDYTAYKVATHLIARSPGALTPFRTLEELRDIARWGEGGVISADRLESLLPYLTVWSRRETGAWLAEQLVVNQLPTTDDGTSPDTVEVQGQPESDGQHVLREPRHHRAHRRRHGRGVSDRGAHGQCRRQATTQAVHVGRRCRRCGRDQGVPGRPHQGGGVRTGADQHQHGVPGSALRRDGQRPVVARQGAQAGRDPRNGLGPCGRHRQSASGRDRRGRRDGSSQQRALPSCRRLQPVVGTPRQAKPPDAGPARGAVSECHQPQQLRVALRHDVLVLPHVGRVPHRDPGGRQQQCRRTDRRGGPARSRGGGTRRRHDLDD